MWSKCRQLSTDHLQEVGVCVPVERAMMVNACALCQGPPFEQSFCTAIIRLLSLLLQQMQPLCSKLWTSSVVDGDEPRCGADIYMSLADRICETPDLFNSGVANPHPEASTIRALPFGIYSTATGQARRMAR